MQICNGLPGALAGRPGVLPSTAPCGKHVVAVRRRNEGKRIRQGTILAANKEVSGIAHLVI